MRVTFTLVGGILGCAEILACGAFESTPATTTEDASIDATGDASADANETSAPVDAASADVVVLPGKLVFMSKGSVKPGNGMVAAANALCNEEAANAQVPKKFIAWLSTVAEPAGIKIQSNGPWILRTGQLVFADSAALFASDIKAPILLRADGSGAPTTTTVWTGTLSGGGAAANCADWANVDPAAVGIVGSPALLEAGKWTEATAENCTVLRPVLCFEND